LIDESTAVTLAPERMRRILNDPGATRIRNSGAVRPQSNSDYLGFLTIHKFPDSSFSANSAAIEQYIWEPCIHEYIASLLADPATAVTRVALCPSKKPAWVGEVQREIDCASDAQAARGEPKVTLEAELRCNSLVSQLAAIIEDTEFIEVAAFGDGEGGLELIVHSFASKRRLSIDISRCGVAVASTIDERGFQQQYDCNLLVGLIAWLNVQQ
jgi:hypothetical protein